MNINCTRKLNTNVITYYLLLHNKTVNYYNSPAMCGFEPKLSCITSLQGSFFISAAITRGLQAITTNTKKLHNLKHNLSTARRAANWKKGLGNSWSYSLLQLTAPPQPRSQLIPSPLQRAARCLQARVLSTATMKNLHTGFFLESADPRLGYCPSLHPRTLSN